MSSGPLRAALLAALTLGPACREPDPAPAKERKEPAHAREKRALRSVEQALFAATDFSRLPPSPRATGANPYALLALAEGSPAAFASVLQGDDALVLHDEDGAPRARVPTPPEPSALTSSGKHVFVAGRIEPRVARYRLDAEGAHEAGSVELPGAHSLRAVLAFDGSLYAADFARDRLYSLELAELGEDVAGAPRVRELPTCGGPFRLLGTSRFLGVLCLFEHALALYQKTPDGGLREVSRLRHDGPIWSAAMLELDAALVIALGGVEDHPLVREHKVFGHVDSFVEVWRFDGTASPERLENVNTAELTVVTPKALDLAAVGSELELGVLGYASERRLVGRFDPARPGSLRFHHEPSLPGCAAVATRKGRRLCANPLFDAWVVLDDAAPRVIPARAERAVEPSALERLGEALFYTTLMAPDASSTGALSRFTCETCHFEGGTDGRVHHSGRGGISVSTRPLYGLFNNGPHFSRAKDPDLTSVSFNEFVVANAGNPVDPFFALDVERFAFVERFGVARDSLAPAGLREALLRYLARATHPVNPRAVSRPQPRRFTAEERRGAELFRSHCAECHASRLVARDPATALPFERWESAVLSPEAPVVWARADYEKVGVLPYVDAKGTRIPSLRRLFLKRPYFTNGSAATLADVLALSRRGPSGAPFVHVATPGDATLVGLSPSERAALQSFLELL